MNTKELVSEEVLLDILANELDCTQCANYNNNYCNLLNKATNEDYVCLKFTHNVSKLS